MAVHPVPRSCLCESYDSQCDFLFKVAYNITTLQKRFFRSKWKSRCFFWGSEHVCFKTPVNFFSTRFAPVQVFFRNNKNDIKMTFRRKPPQVQSGSHAANVLRNSMKQLAGIAVDFWCMDFWKSFSVVLPDGNLLKGKRFLPKRSKETCFSKKAANHSMPPKLTVNQFSNKPLYI